MKALRTPLILTTFALAVAISALVVSSLGQGKRPAYDPQRIVKKFPSIRDAEVLTDPGKSDLRPDELVLGVIVGGEARAYPINQLTRPTREIINDRLGGEAIAATW